MPETQKIAVIGAGMAGLTAASRLADAGCAVTVFEKSRGIGGRMATRRTRDGYVFDHGAQFFKARTEAFSGFVSEAVDQNCAAVWHPRMAAGERGGESWFCGTPGMNGLMRGKAEKLDIRFLHELASVMRAAEGLRLQMKDGASFAGFERVLLSSPAPQAKRLLQGFEEADGLFDEVVVAPCWALMIVPEEGVQAGFDVWRSRTSDIAWFARNNAKPERWATDDRSEERWVVHASPEWSERHLEHDAGSIAPMLLEVFERQTGLSAGAHRYLSAHRWRYAMTVKPLGQPFAALDDGRIMVCGDWCLGGRVEAAFESGLAAADHMLGSMR